MAYANLAAVKARAGSLSTAWGPASQPANDDIVGFLADVAAEIDGVISSRGFALPADGSPAASALRGVNADGALLLALEATYPEATGPGSAEDEIKRVRKRYELAVDRIAAGTHPALALLESTASTASATSTWTDRDPALLPPFEARRPPLEPRFRRGQSL